MAALQQLEFFLLRYAGDASKRESINVGVVAIAQGTDFADVRFTRNWRRLQCFDPLLDTDELDAMEREIRRDLQDPQRRSELVRRTTDAWSNLIQCEPLNGCITESPAEELERLGSLYLETPVAKEKAELHGRQRILECMRTELEKAGVLPLILRNISLTAYTPQNPLKADFGHPGRQSFKFFQAVSLRQGINSGVVWARRFPQIAASIKQEKGITAWLTAVVDDDLPKRDDVNCAIDFMKDSGIVVAPAAKMSEIAEGIRLELEAR